MNAWTLFHIRGIPLKAHITLLIAIPYFAIIIAAQLFQMAGLAGFEAAELKIPAFGWGLILAFGLFASVALHELGHTFVAMRNGRKVHSITLMLLGGMSHIEGEHDDDANARQKKSGEAWIAAIGPLVSLVLAVALYAGHSYTLSIPDLSFGLFYLSQLNMTIAVFNMVPAYPLDGGRVLRALLSNRMGTERATSAAIAVSKGFAIAFALVGLLSFNFVLLLIALFVYSAGVYESRMMHIKKMLNGMRADSLMHQPIAKLSAAMSVDAALNELAVRRQELGTVTNSEGRFLGVVDLKILGKVASERRQSVPVGLVAKDDITRLGPSASAISAVEGITTQGPVSAIVNDEGVLLGIVDADDIRRALELKDIDKRRAA